MIGRKVSRSFSTRPALSGYVNRTLSRLPMALPLFALMAHTVRRARKSLTLKSSSSLVQVRFPHSLCVRKYDSVGIGVTPFASVLQSIRWRVYNAQNDPNVSSIPLQKVYFFWICRDKSAFEWFNTILAGLSLFISFTHPYS